MRYENICKDCKAGCCDQSGSKVDPENYCDRDQLYNGGGNVEEQEIEHGIDALGAALNNLGDLASSARKVETQGKPVQAVKNILRKIARCLLADAFKNDVAHIIKSRASKAPQSISEHQGQCGEHRLIAGRRHAIDCIFISKGQ